MYKKKISEDICGNCQHEIVVNEVRCFHAKYSSVCLVTDCLCMDATGRDSLLDIGTRYPFNKRSFWNKDSMRNVIHKW